MIRRLLALAIVLVPGSAFSAVKTCDLPNNQELQNRVLNRNMNSFFKAGNNEVKTLVKLKGSQGKFERQGTLQADTLSCIRYLSYDEMNNLSGSLNAPGLDLSNYFASPCDVMIAAEWVTANKRGRVLWCAPFYVGGAEVQGYYWQNTNWEDPAFTDLWNGRWQ